MRETEFVNQENPSYPVWWKRVLIGAAIGCFIGGLEIWFYNFSLRDLLAAVLTGAAFFAVLGALAVKCKTRPSVIALSGIAGMLAGSVYWLVARPTMSPVLVVAIGLVGGSFYAFVESRS